MSSMYVAADRRSSSLTVAERASQLLVMLRVEAETARMVN